MSWVETLLAATTRPPTDDLRRGPNTEAMAVLVCVRPGRKGDGFLVATMQFQTVGLDASDSITPLAAECWDVAKEKVANIGDGRRYDAQIKVCESDDEGKTLITETSDWCEVDQDGAGMTDDDADDFDLRGGLPSQMLRVAMAQNKELFRANISLVRASAFLLRETMGGHADRIENDFQLMGKVREIQTQLFETQRSFAEEEAEAKEVEEMGKTARMFFTNAHEAKMARSGVRPPPVPKTRHEAAKALRLSLTIGQLDAIGAKLGEEKAARLMQMVEGAGSGNMTDEQIQQMLDAAAAGTGEVFELMDVATHVFSDRYVSSAHAVWQTRMFRVLLEGPADKEDAA